MFFGEYQYKVDQKGRIALPPELREEFRTGVVLRRGAEKCVDIYPISQWEEMAHKLITPTPSRSKIRRMNRFIFGTAFKLYPDAQGRIVIPPPLRQYAGITDTAVIVGVNHYLEIWSKESWEGEQELMSEEMWHIFESTEGQQ